jgi:hypothetical protein
MGLNFRKQRNNEQRLLRGIQEMDEKVAVDVPIIEFLRIRPSILPFWRTQIDDQPISPGRGLLRDTVLAAAQLADGSPSFRSKRADRFLAVPGHVDSLFCLGRLVGGRVAEANPDVARPLIGLFASKAARNTNIAVLKEMVLLLFCQGIFRGSCFVGYFGQRPRCLVW